MTTNAGASCFRVPAPSGVLLLVVTAFGHGCGSGAEPGGTATKTGEDLFELETFGGNGRTCRTCHSKENGTVTIAQANALFENDPEAPLFRSIDSDDGESNSYERLRENATIRVTLPIASNIRLKDEPSRKRSP